MISRVVRQWWWEQEAPVERLAVTRLVVGAALLRATLHAPPGDLFVREARVLDAVLGRRPSRLTAGWYEAMRVVSLATLAAWTAGCDQRLVAGIANVSTIVVHRQSASLDPRSWNYSTHLHVYMALLSMLGRRDRLDPAVASRILALLQAQYAAVYLQAAVSKLHNGGLAWADGRTVRGSWAESGTLLGRHLARCDRRLAMAASIGALVFQLLFVVLAVFPGRPRRLAGIASLAFHAATKLTLGISFWHFVWFAVPLFLMPVRRAVNRNGR